MEVRFRREIGLAAVVLLSLTLRAVGSLPSTDEIDSSAVEMNQHGVIRSPNFPGCCWPNGYLIEYEGQPGTGFIRLIFDDLDLPKESILQIHDGANETARPFPVQPGYVSGAWVRPVIASTGGQVFVKFSPGTVTSKEFVGFKATYWTVKTPGPETWKENQPFTDCPRIGDPMDGGEVKVDVIKFPWQHIHYRFDCVWQLKPPKGKTDGLRIYFRVVSMNLEDGRAELHSDTSSDGPRIALFKNMQATDHKQLDAAGQPRTGYTSSTGFYIRLQKPTEEGLFHYVYGVYTAVSKNAKTCSISYDGKSLPGFVCNEVYDDKKWCIPKEHICNSLPNCPDASDEDHTLCKTTTVSPTPTPNEDGCFLKECLDGSCVQVEKGCPGECGMFEKSCPNGACVSILVEKCPVGVAEQRCSVTEKLCKNGKCVNFLDPCPNQCTGVEKRCNDGSCVSRYYGTCPGECIFSHKRCKNNKCVPKYERCPEESCPSYKPFKCDVDKCLYTSETCDSVYHCDDKTDETDCDTKVSATVSPLLALVAVPVLVIVIVVRICCRASRNQQQTSPGQVYYKPGMVVGLVLTLFCFVSIGIYFYCQGNKSLTGPSNRSSSIVILPVLLVVLVSFIFIVGCFYGRKRKCRGQHFSSATATQNGTAYTGTRMQPVPAASAGISPGNGRSAVTYQPHYGTSGSPRDQHPPSTPIAGNAPDNLLNNYSTYLSDPPSYTSNPPSLRRSSERLIPPHADERTHLDPSPVPAPGTLAPPGAGGLTPSAPPPSYDEAMQAAVPSAPPAPSPQATPNLGLTPNSGCTIRNNHHSLPNVTLALPQNSKAPSRSNSFRHERHHSMMMNHTSLPNFSLAVQPTCKTGFGSFRSYRELPTYDNVMTANGTQHKSPQSHAPPRPPDPDSDPGEPDCQEPTITTTRRREPKSRMRGIHGWGGGIFDTSSSDQDSTSSDD